MKLPVPPDQSESSKAMPWTISRGYAIIILGVLAALIVGVDQLTKIWVRDILAPHYYVMVVIPRVVHFVYVENRGAAFGMLEGARTFFVIIALVVFLMVIAYIATSRQHRGLEVIALGLIVGGAIGNLIDRVTQGFVTDFIALSFIEFPVFNVADIGVTIGSILFIISLLMRMSDEQKH